MKIVYPEDRTKTIHRIKERRTGDRSTKWSGKKDNGTRL
jgi:hypothetical protein